MFFPGVGKRQKKALRLSVRHENQRKKVNMDYCRAAAGARMSKKMDMKIRGILKLPSMKGVTFVVTNEKGS